MKICVPTDSDQGLAALRGAHFGRAAFYTVVELVDNKIVNVTSVQNMGHAQGGCSTAVANIKQLGASALIVIGIGQSPLIKFRQEGIEVYVDRQSHTVEQCVGAYIDGKLPLVSLENSCTH